MSFDPQIFDEDLFGAAEVLSGEGCLFDPAIFDSAIFDTCEDDGGVVVSVPLVEQASNWQAHHRRIWRHRTKRELEEIVAAERIALGILPAPVVERAIEAAKVVDARIEKRIEEAVEDDYSDITEAVAREYLAAQIIIQEFKSELAAYRKSRNRRAAVLLLAH